MPERRRVLCWTDARGVATLDRPSAYEKGIHHALAEVLNATEEFAATPATGEDVFHSDAFGDYQALVMWGHGERLSEDTQHTLVRRVESGNLGMVGLHSLLIFTANPFLVGRLLGQTEPFGWEDDVPLHFEVVADHPVLAGIPSFDLTDEAYYEPFGLVEGAEVCLQARVRSPGARKVQVYNHETGRYERRPTEVGGSSSRAAWLRRVGRGRVFYFQPGHETAPTYHHPVVQDILRRATRYVAAPV